MKILLLNVGTQEGGEISGAITNALVENYPNAIFRTVNVFKGVGLGAMKKCNKFFSMPYGEASIPVIPKIFNKIISKTKNRLKKFLYDYEPDVVICVHIYASIIMGAIRSDNYYPAKNAKLISIYPEFYVSAILPFASDCDALVVANNEIKNLIKEKLPKSKYNLLPFGIPISKKFMELLDRGEAIDFLNLEPSRLSVLVVDGEEKTEKIVKTIKKLIYELSKDNYQMICVCRKNQKAKILIDKYILKNKLSNVKNYGITNNLDIMLSASDFIVTNTFGSVIYQALNKNVKIISGGCFGTNEKFNYNYLKNKGVITYAGDRFEKFSDTIRQIKQTETKPNEYEKNVKKQNAGKALCDYIMEKLTK